MDIEQYAADDSPDDWGVSAPLACAIDGVKGAMLVEGIRDSKRGFQFELGLLESSRMDEYDIFVQSMTSADQASKRRDDPIVTACCVVVEVN